MLDAMNQIVYDDDAQVVRIVAYKLRDNQGLCGGCTKVKVSPFWNDNAVLDL